MSNSNQIDLAWKMVLKLSCMICITSFFCLMMLLMSGIHYWTLGVVFLISLAGSNYVISKFEYIKAHEPAYRQFVITVTMFAIILLFMALLVKKVTDNEFQNLMLYGTLPVMVNFLMVFTKWILHKYRISRLEQKQKEKEEHRAKEGLYGGL